MRNDEFNKIEITNEKQVRDSEFGKTQRFEFTPQKDNTLPEGELNEKYVGKTIRKKTEVNVEYTNKAPVHGSTTVTSTTTASRVAATTTTVATAASVVAITTISVVTGISIALHDYEYRFDSFFVSSDALTYELYIVDHKNERPDGENYEEYYEDEEEPVSEEESYPFILRVYNDDYDYTMPTWLYYNSGTFSNLEVGEEYHIVLKENKFGGEVLLDETFTTKKNAYVSDYFIDGAYDSLNKGIYVGIYYVDEIDVLSDFTVTLTKDDKTFSFRAPKNAGYHLASVEGIDLEMNTTYKYTLSYKNNGDVAEFGSGEVTFYDINPGVSEMRSVTWDKKCNFITGIMDISLDYQDDYNRFSDFKFVLTSEMVTADGNDVLTYDLEKKTGFQEIKLDDNPMFNLVVTYDYMFTYKDSEKEVEQIIDSGTVHFEDNSETNFNEFIFDKTANFKNRTFDVRLDYTDYYDAYSDFVLCFYQEDPESDGLNVELEKTTTLQTINAMEYDIDIFDSYLYRLTCSFLGEEMILEEGEVAFEDNSGAVVEFYDLIFDEKANFDTRTFDLQLDYKDDLDFLYGFEFTLRDLENDTSKTFELEKTTDVQTIDVSEITSYDEDDNPIYYIDVVEHVMEYSFKYYNNYDEVIAVDSKEFRFENSLVSTFTGIETPYDFTGGASMEYLLPIRYIFDDAAHIYESFEAAIYVGDELMGHMSNDGSVKTEWQYLELDLIEGHQIEDITDTSEDVKLVITALLKNEQFVDVYTEIVNFTVLEKQDLYSATIFDNIAYGSYEITLIPIFAGYNYYIDLTLIIECQTGKKYECDVYVYEANQICYAQLMYCSNFDEETFGEDFDEGVKISLKYRIQTGYAPGESEDSSSIGGEPIYTEYKTIVLYESFKFVLSA